MALIERAVAIEALEHAAEYYSRIDDCTEHSIRQCIGTIKKIPTIDPIRAAGGCRCGECKKHMTPKCLLCDFDVDGSCSGGPESDFYCGDSEPREEQNDE